MTQITFVKKILSNGELCKKCHEVSERLISDGLLDTIDHIAIADERDLSSEGMRLAKEHSVTRAPFFVVRDEKGGYEIFDVYFKFKKYIAEASGEATKTAFSEITKITDL